LTKILLLAVILFGQLFAQEQESTLKIYHQIFSDLLHKKQIKVYTDDRELRNIFRKSKDILLVVKPEVSDIVIVGSRQMYERIIHRIKAKGGSSQTLVFATDYRLLKQYPDIVGALYWKKGRSQLLFLKPRLDRYHIVLPTGYEPYILEQI
jgi:hypothetical protein